MQFNFAIIGGGLTATAMLWQFVYRLQRTAIQGQLDPSRIEIQIYERQNTFGPGFPHNERFVLPFHVTNMCASDMGILEGKPDDFQDWVIENSADLRKRFSGLGEATAVSEELRHACNHYPRAIMGAYLKARFQEAVRAAKNMGLAVSLYPSSEVINLRRNGDRVRLSILDLSSENRFFRDADRVLLATGHWFENNDKENYFSSPWPAEKLRRSIPQGVTVAVIGTSLSAIETVLTLTSDGSFIRSRTGQLTYMPSGRPRKLMLYSRNGLLPKVRGKLGHRRNAYLNHENLGRLLSENLGNLTLEPIFKLLDAEMEAVYGQTIDWQEVVNPSGMPADLLQGYLNEAVAGDGPDGELVWQTVLYQIFDMARDLYLNLAFDERRRFDKTYTSVFFTHAASQPAINAEKLLALMKAGIVKVFRLGKNYRLVRNEADGVYEFIYRDIQGHLKRDAYRYLVNARGQEKTLETNPSALARNLLKSKMIQIGQWRPLGRRPPARVAWPFEPESAGEYFKSGSIFIEPETHRVMHMNPNGNLAPTRHIYAVGAMTRGQIIDASMARGIVRATSIIADDLFFCLKRKINQYP